MIRLENVTKFYELKGGDRHYVLQDLTLEIPPNRNIAILGPNGAGKSTLLRMIGGAESPNSGRIVSDAHISWPLGVSAGFQGSLTARENIEFVCRINGLSQKETREVIQNVQEFAEIGNFFEQDMKTYSSGMRARVAFGLSIVFDFDYYLIDELTSVGDAAFRAKAQAEFKKIRERASLIFVSHNMAMLQEACDAAIVLGGGNAVYYPDIDRGIDAYEETLPPGQRVIAKKRAAAKKAAAKKAAAKKVAAKKVPAKKAATKKVPAKKVTNQATEAETKAKDSETN